MSVFGAYSKYYNLLYQDKDYQGETDYILALLEKVSGKSVKTILDIGSGTGSHDLLMAARGYEVDGVDRSEEMVRVARERSGAIPNARFHVGDAQSFQLGKQFDAVLSLFHVMSYQTSNKDLHESFARAYEHLAPGGTFIFDFWYGPGVLSDLPVLRVKRMEDESIRLLRVATPSLDANKNVVTVAYDILLEDKATGKVDRLEESHLMRFLFKPELDYMLEAAGFKVINFLEWMSFDKAPGLSTWNACIVATK